MRHALVHFGVAALGALLFLAPAPANAESGFLGLQVQGMEPDLARALGLKSPGGVIIRDVAMGEAGALAGFRRGDVIVSFAGRKIKNFDDLIEAVGRTKPSQKIPVGILRGDGRRELTIKLGDRPKSWRIERAAFVNFRDLGMTVVAMTEKVRKRFSLRWGATGLVVTRVDKNKSLAKNLASGDIIAQVNLREIWRPSQLTSQFEQARKSGRKAVLLLVEKPSGFSYILLRVPRASK